MALTKVLTGGIADDAIGNTKLALDADYAFTGTISGAGLASPFPTGTAVTSVGGAATANIAQGLAKTWIRFNGQNTIAIADSFNITSITDVNTGDYTVTIANNYANVNYCINLQNDDTAITNQVVAGGVAVGAYRQRSIDGSNNRVDAPINYSSTHGDLA